MSNCRSMRLSLKWLKNWKSLKWSRSGCRLKIAPIQKKKVTLYSVRKVFDRFCSKYPFVRRHLSATAPIIHEPLFESAVAKLQGNDFNLTPGEKKKVSYFLVCDSEAGSDEDEDHANMSFLDEALDDAAAESCKRQKKARPYRSMDHAPATSNVVERLFSRCGIIMRPHRRLMDPSTLEMLIGTHVRLTRLWSARRGLRLRRQGQRLLPLLPFLVLH